MLLPRETIPPPLRYAPRPLTPCPLNHPSPYPLSFNLPYTQPPVPLPPVPSTPQWLVNKLGTRFITDRTTDGATPLHMAACRSNTPHHVSIVTTSSTAQGNVDILRFFLDRLENEGDVNIQDSIQATPAHDAAEFGQTQAMILLLKAGADLSIQDYVSVCICYPPLFYPPLCYPPLCYPHCATPPLCYPHCPGEQDPTPVGSGAGTHRAG